MLNLFWTPYNLDLNKFLVLSIILSNFSFPLDVYTFDNKTKVLFFIRIQMNPIVVSNIQLSGLCSASEDGAKTFSTI